MSPTNPARAATARASEAATVPTGSLERPIPSGANAAGFGSDVVADTLRALDIPYIALNPGASYRGLHDSPRQLSRQRDAADAAVPARGDRGRDRARLRQGDRPRDGGRGAFQCRPDARHHGDLQRLVRPHAGDRARRHRSGRCGEAPAVDRLDPHRARPGRDGARLSPNGTTSPPRRAPRARRCCAPTGSPTARRWRRSTSISTPRCRRRSCRSRCRRSTLRASFRPSPRLRRTTSCARPRRC